LQWAGTVLFTASAVPSLLPVVAVLENRLSLLRKTTAALLSSSPSSSVRARLPRPLLFLVGYTASSLYLLEQAVWSATEGREEKETDEWVVKRWVEEGGGQETVREVEAVLKGSEEGLEEEKKREREVVYGREKW
jgi:hypothetical protein